MHHSNARRWSRRAVLEVGARLAGPLAILAAGSVSGAAVGPLASGAGAQVLPPTPECREPGDPTPSQTEGPFFKPNSPERQSLLTPEVSGRRLIVTGFVLSRTCQPVAGVLVDFWQADAAGQYDNAGYRLRGHQFTDAAGRYQLETIVPGLYAGRTRHLHVRVQAPNQRVLTTQLYFPDEPRNRNDGLFNPALTMSLADSPDGQAGAFNFVLNQV